MRILLDTCVLAEFHRGNEVARQAIKDLPDENLFISALSIGEISKGISLLDTGKKKKALMDWLLTLGTTFGDRVIPIDKETAELWGHLSARAQKSGVVVPAVDGLICATALQHGLAVMTRNAKHFSISGIHVIDPWRD